MEITSVTITKGATINTGNYSSRRVEIGATASIENAHAKRDYEQLLKFVDSKVNVEIGKAVSSG